MAALSALYPYIIPHVPNMPEMAIDRALVDAAIEFCRQSLAWQQRTDPIQLIPGVREYDVDVIGCEPVRVLAAVIVGDRALDRRPMASLDLPEAGEPTGFVQPVPRLIELAETPVRADSLVLRVAVEPSMSATVLDDQLVRYWREPIAAGALMRLLLQQGDMSRASVAAQAFQGGVERAYAQAQVGAGRGRLRVRPVP
ncbi:hypothetical protein [Thauera aromatica]|uniref:Uncharacterized protein n=1 Tax=Thauera aromatica K172 TaxID=44139 RepID=A0A2R4BP20_THAAR|nr:hypothetical protein [Thauera aromatica]AVR89020.1 hypothetical protein Tharo_2117 [Thauera aromatica K172]